jgi:hypothetical protein
MKRLLPAAVATACIALAGAASAALIKVGDLVLTADGGFTPRALPRKAYSPIDFEGHANIRTVGGGIPKALKQAVIDFDHDGRLSTRGLPTCDPALLQEATPEEARARCRGARVGTGHVEALIAGANGTTIHATSLVSLFNGPPQEGHPTVILHARTTEPAVQNFVITVPIVRRRGEFRYRAIVDLPPIVAGRGALTHIDVDIGRRYRFAGKRRSYVSARCRDGILSTHGHFTFADEPTDLIVSGAVEKPCTPL